MTAPRELFLHYAGVAELRADHETHLRRGRAFVRGPSSAAPRDVCDLVIVHPETGAALRVSAEIVYVSPDGPDAGVGLAWPAPTGDAAERLRAFVEDAVAELLVVDDEPGELEVVDERPGELLVVDDEPGELLRDDAPGDVEAADDAPGAPIASSGDPSAHLHERIRHLSQAEQQRLARGGSLPERTMLERVFGPAVWEALLQNARLTHPEVARIAKKGTLPRPLVEQIAANAGWLGSPEVQRALLSNPRSSPVVVARVLRALPKGDLSRVPQQTAYPMAVRLAAKKLLQG
ncbi:MAG: hypothetical protein IT374_11735 [Polyangiaceae bacterium]|nr:hypothetical protein [Polyangiaceae bacterium]